jgi:hypothetical protein
MVSIGSGAWTPTRQTAQSGQAPANYPPSGSAENSSGP